MSVDSTIWLVGIAMEALVVGVLLYRRIASLLPVFFIFSAWNLVSDLANAAVRANYSYNSSQYFHFYVGETSVDAFMQFAVLVELAWSVLRPYRSSLPRYTIVAISVLVLVAGAVVWPLTGFTVLHGLPLDWTRLMRLEQTVSSLRILFFLGLAALSQLLAIGWRDRELQVATGLGFYSLISMGAALLHTHHALPAQFHKIDSIVAFSSLGSLLYWSYSFLQKEAPRQQFSPRMQSLLLSVAGAARANRLVIEDIRKTNNH